MTVLAIEKELSRKTPEKSITDSWSFPEGTEVTFDKGLLLSAIINRGASFSVAYPDPDYFYNMSAAWWSKWSANFLKWLQVMQTEYNPIENYDRQEKWHDDIVDDNTITDTGTLGTSGTNTSTNEVSAYDAGTYQPKNKVTDGINTTDTHDLTNKVDNDRDVDHEGRIHGNIGTMTTQSMATEEIRLRYNNTYNMMADIFCSEMLVAVY